MARRKPALYREIENMESTKLLIAYRDAVEAELVANMLTGANLSSYFTKQDSTRARLLETEVQLRLQGHAGSK